MSIFVILGLLVCTEAPGSSAVTPVFVQKGNDVLLNVMKADVLQDVSFVVWNFNKTVLVRFVPGREPTVPPAYTGRVEFSVNDYSLKVKNLQEADSGVYTARVIGDTQEQTTEYNVTVQGSSAVTPVFVQKGNDVLLNVMKADVLQDVFTVVWNFNKKVVLVRFSPGREPTVPPAYTGRVEFSVNDYSLKVKNLQEADSGVYTARVTGDIEELTEYNVTVQDSGPLHNDIPVTVIVLVTITMLCIIAVSAVCYRRKRRTYKRENTENIVYADPEMKTVAESPDPTNDASDSSILYSLVGTHTGSTETRVDPPDSGVYAQVEITARS